MKFKKLKTVSVVIPYYNGSHYIERALKSVLNQTVKAAEIFIVDDGSNETEAAFLRELAKSYQFTLLTKPNGGQGSARNLGVKSSKAEYVCFLDQDDYFLEWHIEHLLSVVKKQADERFGFAYGDLWRGNEDGQVLQHSTSVRHAVHPKTDLYMQIKDDMHILPSASIIKISAFLEIGGFDERFMGYEDDDLFIRFFAAGYTSVFSTRPVTFWTINKSSTSYSIKMSRSRFTYVKKLMESFPDDIVAGQFIFRDLILPRFMPTIVNDYLRSLFFKDAYLDENRGRLAELRSFFLQNQSTKGQKRKKFALDIATSINPTILRALLKLAVRFPFSILLKAAGYEVLLKGLKRILFELKEVKQ